MTIISGKEYQVQPLNRTHDRSTFQCGEKELDEYFQKHAGQEGRKKVTAPFVLVDVAIGSVAGYYTLSMHSILLADLPDKLIRQLPRYPSVPSALLGRLAVSTGYQGKQLGKYLLMDAINRVLSSDIAAFCLVVDAKNSQAKSFYEQYGFIPFAEFPDRLFLPLKSIG